MMNRSVGKQLPLSSMTRRQLVEHFGLVVRSYEKFEQVDRDNHPVQGLMTSNVVVHAISDWLLKDVGRTKCEGSFSWG
jgi:hypothetical protein